MKKEFLALAAMLLGCAAVAAQSVGGSSFGVAGMEGMGGKTQVAAPSLSQGSCPVTMQASHLADGSMMKTGGIHPAGIGQWLSLTLTGSRDKKQIVTGTLLVHGVKPVRHVAQAISSTNGPEDIAKTLTIPFRTDAKQNAQARLWVPGMSAVDRIDLLSLDYNDGSTWTAVGSGCHVIPDPKMLLVNR